MYHKNKGKLDDIERFNKKIVDYMMPDISYLYVQDPFGLLESVK
jgi:hypothetical protein